MTKSKTLPNPRSTSSVDIFIGERIRAIRLLREMSQEKLGEACGITFQQVQKYERGANRVSVSRLIEIAEALDVSLATFLPDTICTRDNGRADTHHMLIRIRALEEKLKKIRELAKH